jgi:hypothetical protein
MFQTTQWTQEPPEASGSSTTGASACARRKVLDQQRAGSHRRRRRYIGKEYAVRMPNAGLVIFSVFITVSASGAGFVPERNEKYFLRLIQIQGMKNNIRFGL